MIWMLCFLLHWNRKLRLNSLQWTRYSRECSNSATTTVTLDHYEPVPPRVGNTIPYLLAVFRSHVSEIHEGKIGNCTVPALLISSLADYIWATSWENLFMQYASNKGADLPAHPRSLISTFIFRCLDSIIPLVSISEISSFYLAAVAAQAGLCLTWHKPRNKAHMAYILVAPYPPWGGGRLNTEQAVACRT